MTSLKSSYKKALVTGASSGIGESLSRKLASKGINLIITGRNKEKLQNLANELGSTVAVEIVVADLSTKEGRKAVVQAIHSHVPDLVINNAGIGLYDDVINHPTEVSISLLDINSNPVVELSVEAAKAMVSHNIQGVILNVSSVAAFFNFPCFAMYAASKAFVNRFSESFDIEMKPKGVRVLTACPGMVATNFRQRASKKKGRSRSRSMTPEYAAEQIWKQIRKKKRLHIFSWHYKPLVFAAKYLIPTKIIDIFLYRYMKKHFA